jgi:hypothetical protein
MKTILRIFAALLLSLPALASHKPFKDTSDYRDKEVLKGYLNVKYDTYATMYKEPKGTDCDWVMVSPDFNLDAIRKEPVTLIPASINRGGASDASFWGSYGLWYGNGITSAFESALRSRGLNIRHLEQSSTPAVPANPVQAMMMQAYGMQPNVQQAPKPEPQATEPPPLTALQARIENDRYDEDKKKFGVDEAAKRAEEREKKRVDDWRAAQGKANADATESARPKNPEDMKGLVLVVYLTESKVNTAGAWIPFVPVTNTTTGEFILLKDGKPILAGRHNSVGAYSNSAPKCGTALATAFDIKVKP